MANGPLRGERYVTVMVTIATAATISNSFYYLLFFCTIIEKKQNICSRSKKTEIPGYLKKIKTLFSEENK